MSFRSFLYALARLMGDVNAVQKNRVPRRIARRVTGHWLGRLMRSIFG